jgi:hypothetical protein
LHQDYEHHEQRHEHVNDQEQIDHEVHQDGQYRQSRSIVNDRERGTGFQPVNSSTGCRCYDFTRLQI